MKLYRTIAGKRGKDGEWIEQHNVEFTEEEYAQRAKEEIDNADMMRLLEIESIEEESQTKIQKAAIDFADRLLLSSSEEQESIKAEYKLLKESIIAEKQEKHNAVNERR